MRHTLREDLDAPLDKVERSWMRRPAVIVLWPLIVFLAVIHAVVEVTRDWFSDCWNYKY